MEDIRTLGLTYKLASSETSFVAINKKTNAQSGASSNISKDHKIVQKRPTGMQLDSTLHRKAKSQVGVGKGLGDIGRIQSVPRQQTPPAPGKTHVKAASPAAQASEKIEEKEQSPHQASQPKPKEATSHVIVDKKRQAQEERMRSIQQPVQVAARDDLSAYSPSNRQHRKQSSKSKDSIISFKELLTHAKFNGCFDLPSKVIEKGVRRDTLKQVEKKLQGHKDLKLILSTLVGIVILETQFAARQVEWMMVRAKAILFLQKLFKAAKLGVDPIKLVTELKM